MKKTLHILFIFLVAYANATSAQTYSVSGPRTVFELAANKGTGKYTFFNFDTGKEVAASDSNSLNWHIAFSKTSVILNGGLSGPGGSEGVSGQVLSSTTFETQTEAPTTGYVLDGNASAKAIPSSSWYNYYPGASNSGPHTIIPMTDKLIALKLSDGRYVKVEMLNYYKGAPLNVPTTGSTYTVASAQYSFRYLVSEVGSTDWSQELTVVKNIPATTNVPQYFNLTAATLISTEEKDANATWNLLFTNPTDLGAFNAYNINIYGNSGTNGTGTDSLQLVSSGFHLLNDAPSANWTSTNVPAPLWYSYNGQTHVISPIADKVILVKTSLNRYAKIRIDSYYKNEDASNIMNYGYYALTYYFQPDGTKNVTTTAPLQSGIMNTTNAPSLGLYPNPVSSEATSLQTDLDLSDATAQILNMQGMEIYRTTFNGTMLKLDAGHLAKGMYVVVVSKDGTLYQQKLIVE